MLRIGFTMRKRRMITMSKHGVSGHTHTREQLNDYANQHNPNNSAYQSNWDNHANQCNPNNDEYEHSRTAAENDRK